MSPEKNILQITDDSGTVVGRLYARTEKEGGLIIDVHIDSNYLNESTPGEYWIGQAHIPKNLIS
jgi:hypothetical protein